MPQGVQSEFCACIQDGGKTMERHFKQEKLKIEVLNIREEQEHFHQDIELLFVLEGTLDVAMGEQTTHMQPEDILVINANKRHCLKGSPDILLPGFTLLISW